VKTVSDKAVRHLLA